MSDEKPVEPKAPGLTASRFKKGQTGNPGGRPKSLRAFRASSRKLSRDLLKVIRQRMHDPDIPLDHLVKAFEASADRGGYMSADKKAALRITQGRLILAALALEGMKLETKKKLLRGLGVTDELG